jgi:prophage antirepressor-like protein
MDKYKNLENYITFGPSKSKEGKKPTKLKSLNNNEKENIVIVKSDGINKYETIDGNLFKYQGTAIHIIYEDEKPWFRAKDVALILEYKDTRDAISYNVNKEYIKELGKFKGGIHPPLKGNAKNTKYINKKGLLALIMKSKMKEALKFQDWVIDLLEKIDNNESIDYDEKEEIKPDYNIEPINKYTEWCLTHDSIDVSEENILYIGVIGKINNISKNIVTDISNGEIIFKFGISIDEFRRESEHKRNIDTYTCFYIVKCNKHKQMEKAIRKELERKNQMRHFKFNNKVYTELFVESVNFTIGDLQKYIEKWINKYDRSEILLIEDSKLKQEMERSKQEESKTQQEIARAKIAEYEYKKMELEYKKFQESQQGNSVTGKNTK